MSRLIPVPQTSFQTLDEAIRLTNRRVNALDNVVIPNIAAAIAYIDSELSELEREEIFRYGQWFTVTSLLGVFALISVALEMVGRL